MLLLIDNFDSFTHNLARYFRELGCEVIVVRNNDITIDEIARLAPEQLVISPGPCTPNEAGISLEAISRYAGHIPILGVCLGHQAIGQVYGAAVTGAREIRHGKTSTVFHNATGLFKDIPDGFAATRYHSLVIAPDTLPVSLNVDAWCQHEDGYREIMGVSHTTLPVWGVQFHPESLLTEHGHDLLNSFLHLSRRFKKTA